MTHLLPNPDFFHKILPYYLVHFVYPDFSEKNIKMSKALSLIGHCILRVQNNVPNKKRFEKPKKISKF